MKTKSGYTSRPKITLDDLQGHRNDYPGRCDWPLYRPTGKMITALIDCSRYAEWTAKDPRVTGGHRPHPGYCSQHFKMYERLIRYMSQELK